MNVLVVLLANNLVGVVSKLLGLALLLVVDLSCLKILCSFTIEGMLSV